MSVDVGIVFGVTDIDLSDRTQQRHAGLRQNIARIDVWRDQYRRTRICRNKMLVFRKPTHQHQQIAIVAGGALDQ